MRLIKTWILKKRTPVIQFNVPFISTTGLSQSELEHCGEVFYKIIERQIKINKGKSLEMPRRNFTKFQENRMNIIDILNRAKL